MQCSFAKTISQESGTPEIARRLSIDLGDLGSDWKTVGGIMGKITITALIRRFRRFGGRFFSTLLEAILLTARSPTLPTLVKELTDLWVILFCRVLIVNKCESAVE